MKIGSMEYVASYRKRSNGNWQGVIVRKKKIVCWGCPDDHRYRSANPALEESAKECAEKKLKSIQQFI